MSQSSRRHSLWFLALTGLLFPTAVPAQNDAEVSLPLDWNSLVDVTASSQEAATARAKARRIQLFRIGDPLGLDIDDPSDTASADRGLDWIQVAVGNDNPFFDFRRPGDPGGVGYYRLHSQVQVLDNGTTSLAAGLRAVTPAGLDQDGVQNGPTVVSPSMSLYHQLDDGTGLQGFVSRNMHLQTANLNEQARRSVEYGVAVQRPLLETGPDNLGNFYIFVEALGRYRYEDSTGTSAVWEMVPGLHWRMSENLWLSGGVMVPVNQANVSRDAHLWQLTCSFQF